MNGPLQWCAIENHQDPFYVVNEVTLTGQKPSLKFSLHTHFSLPHTHLELWLGEKKVARPK